MPITHVASTHATSQPGENPPPVSADVIPLSFIPSVIILWERLSCEGDGRKGLNVYFIHE